MKKFLVIAPYQYLPYSSGGQKSIAQFLDYLGTETNLTVVSVGENDASLIKTYKHVPLLKSSFSKYLDLSLASTLTALIKKENFDAVIWEHPYYAWLAAVIKRRCRLKTILHTHNMEFQRFRSTGKWWWWILRSYEKWCFKITDQILFVSPDERKFAIENWKINPAKCIEVAFGVEVREYPSDKEQCKQIIKAKHHVDHSEKVLLFNGLLNYKPNLDALIAILKEINPLLCQHREFRYKIIICGKGLPADLNKLRDYIDKNIIYAGFVDDIEMYFKGADQFLNPVQSGGGIKTKIVEAIAFGTTVISSQTGATGIHKEICGKKLVIVPDNSWKLFSEEIVRNANGHDETPDSYYEYYYWGSIVRKVAGSL